MDCGAELYEQAIKYEKGSFITWAGALATLSGAKTGRSPRDKRIVRDETVEDDLWWGKYVTLSSWSSLLIDYNFIYLKTFFHFILTFTILKYCLYDRGSPNIEMDEHTFLVNRERAVDYLNSLDKVNF